MPVASFLMVLTAVVLQALPPLPSVTTESYPPAAREAIRAAARQAAARDRDADAVGALGKTLHAWEQWESAHQAYARARALSGDGRGWSYLDGIVLQRLGRFDAAAAALQQVLRASPDYLPARLRLAEVLLDDGQIEESARLFTELTSLAQAEPAAHVGLGRIAAARGRHEEAVRHFERAVALFPELGAAYYGLARSYRALDRSADAERALAQHTRYGARWPRLDDPILASVLSVREDARATLARGVALAEAGDVAGAIDAHERALAAEPSLTQAHANLVGLYGRAGSWQKADEHYRVAVARHPGDATLHYDYGVVLGLQGKWDAAADAYRQALDANPLHAEARNNLGQILERHRDFAGAADQYRKALEARPTFRLARFNFGRMLLVAAKNDEAVGEFEKLQQPVDDETPRYLFALSTALVRAGRLADGLRLGAEAQRLAAEFGQADLARAIAGELAKLK